MKIQKTAALALGLAGLSAFISKPAEALDVEYIFQTALREAFVEAMQTSQPANYSSREFAPQQNFNSTPQPPCNCNQSFYRGQASIPQYIPNLPSRTNANPFYEPRYPAQSISDYHQVSSPCNYR